MNGERAGAQRRLAAILFADVVGYSRIVAANETGALAGLRWLRRSIIGPQIAAHGGRSFAALGDGVAAEFASAVRAVACAVSMQRALAVGRAATGSGRPHRLALRIGINLGDVVVEPNGDLLGDGVNVAARLEALAEPGGIAISGNTFDELRGRLPYPFADAGEHVLKNIPWAVRVFTLSAAAIDALPAAEPEARRSAPWRPGRAVLTAGFGLVAAALLAGIVWRVPAVQPNAPPSAKTISPARQASLVVLPLANLRGDPEQDYLADGVTDEITSALGGLPGILVIGRGTAFAYRGRTVDARQVGQELGVRYVLEGSMRASGEQVSVSLRLLDVAAGSRLWVDQFDLPRADLARLARTVVTRIGAPLGIELIAAESRRSMAERPDDPDAQDLMLRGRAITYRPPSPENSDEARRLFERAIALNEGSAQAHALLAQVLIDRIYLGWSQDRTADMEKAERHLARALAIDDRNILAHLTRGGAQALRWRFDDAIVEFDMVIALNPNLANAYGNRGATRVLTDQPAEAIADLTEAMRISPRDRTLGFWLHCLGQASLMLGRDGEALDQFMRSAAASPTVPAYQIFLGAAYGLAGRKDEARAALREVRERYPQITIAFLRPNWLVWSPNPLWRAMRERLLDGLRRAGLPEE